MTGKNLKSNSAFAQGGFCAALEDQSNANVAS